MPNNLSSPCMPFINLISVEMHVCVCVDVFVRVKDIECIQIFPFTKEKVFFYLLCGFEANFACIIANAFEHSVREFNFSKDVCLII